MNEDIDIEEIRERIVRDATPEQMEFGESIFKRTKEIPEYISSDNIIVEAAALLYPLGINEAFELLLSLNMSLLQTQQICDCLIEDAKSLEGQIIDKAVMLYRLNNGTAHKELRSLIK